MPKQIIPFTGFDQVGIIRDNPPVSLPPNAFSDARNVRFKDGSVRKMEGEVNAFPNLLDGRNPDGTPNGLSYNDHTLKYVAWWPNPNLADNNSGYYLIIQQEGNNDVAYIVPPGTDRLTADHMKGTFIPDENANWQHTFFQGGFALIINNGLQAPQYILDADGNEDVGMVPNFASLPGWESYNVNETLISDTFDETANTRIFTLPPINTDMFDVIVEVTPPVGAGTRYTFTMGGETQGTAPNTVTLNTGTPNSTLDFMGNTLPDRSQVVVRLVSTSPVNVTAGVIRSFGDFLVAGNLVETELDRNDNIVIVRNLAGVVRTSDVAAPGSIPLNWNPFTVGVSTADEFVLTATGVVQEMGELQGNFYIYSNNSISVMRQTGNVNVPLSVTPITDTYGAQTTEAVVEFDGKHLVIGSQDIYLFGGHPGSIQSVADQRIRRKFFDNLNPLHNQRLFTLRYSQRDEIWICYPTTSSIRGECDQALIWNYRQNVWTVRDLTAAVAGDVGPVPGGGLPTSTNDITGLPGSNQAISAGVAEEQTIMFPDTTIQIIGNHGGRDSVYDLAVENLPGFTSRAASFDFRFTDAFDTGPNYGRDRVNQATDPLASSFSLIDSSDPTAINISPELPRYLTTDKAWDATRTYLAGRGLPGAIDFYPGQRVIDDDAQGNSSIFRVANGFGDGSVPSTFYDPNEQGPFYNSDETLVYHDTFDVVGVRPRDLIAGAPYGQVPGDGGTGNNITPTQARWELVGLAVDEQWGVAEVADAFADALTANATFNQFFRVVNTDPNDSDIQIEPLQSSGTSGFPTYSGVMTEVSFPSFGDQGGMFEDPALQINPSGGSVVTAGGTVVFEFTTTEREYLPFDPMLPSTTGRYAITPSSSVLDRVAVAFNQTFTVDTVNEMVAAILESAFAEDITPFWNVSRTGTNIRLASRIPGNYAFTASVSVPSDIPIMVDNLAISENTVGQRATDGSMGAIPSEAPYFLVSPPSGDVGERAPGYFTPAGLGNIEGDRGVIMQHLLENAIGADRTYRNWTVSAADMGVVTLTTAADDSDDIPPRLRQANRPANGVWQVEQVSPGNTVNTGQVEFSANAVATETTEGVFSLNTTPSYMGILVTNPATASGLEFLLIEADRMTETTAQLVRDKWIPQIRQGIPRINAVTRGSGFFLQPANYDDLANFVLDVRINDTPENAEWIYQIVENGTNPDTGVTGITVNPASDTPLLINGSEIDNTYDPQNIPPSAATGEYLRSGGPLKIAQYLEGVTPTLASLSVTGTTTLIFDIFRPWPSNEVNFNLEYPIFANVFLSQDEGGIFRRLNKITAADIGWSKPSYLFVPRATTEDLVNFREMINEGTDDFPMDYESYFERIQLALTPEFDTEMLHAIALWADGSTPEFLRGNQLRNQLDVRVSATNYPGQLNPLEPFMKDATNNSNIFNVGADYKADMRVHGRFINYRITDATPLQTTTDGVTYSHQSEWRVSGMQGEIMKGGTR